MESQESMRTSPDSPGFEPSLEYAGTSGNVNVDTSRDATIHADMSGITAKAQRYVLALAEQRGRVGITVAELRENDTSLHHGRISGALTNLHKAGRLVALRERRNRCGVYVLPEHVEGREARPFRPNHQAPDEEAIYGVLLQHRYRFGGHNPPCECGWMPSDGDLSHTRHMAREIVAVLL